MSTASPDALLPPGSGGLPLRSLFPLTARATPAGHLELGGIDAVALARQFGTPLYVFDEATLRHQCRSFRREFERRYTETSVLYACKAFINRALAGLLREEGLGLDVVSGGELAIARAASFPLERVYFHGNNKSPQELRQALEAGIGRIVLDNFREMALLEELAAAQGVRQKVLLRLSPGVDPHTHALTTTGVTDSKFGFTMVTGQAAQALQQALGSPHLQLVGLHFHLGSPIFELEPYCQALEVVLDFAARHRAPLEELSPGGGFAIQYVPEQEPPPVAHYAEAIVGALETGLKKRGLTRPRLLIEPGRAIVGRAGVALYTVGASKDIPGVRRYVSVDGGMADNIRPALYGSRYRALLANRVQEEGTETVTIAGKFCESGDILLRDALLPPCRPGDVLALPAAGAYCLAMASNYNASLKPAIVLVKDGQATLIRRRETYEDLLALDG